MKKMKHEKNAIRATFVCGATVFAALFANGKVEEEFYPLSTNDYEVVIHQDYSLGYWETNEIPAWVIEHLYPEMFATNYERSSGFRMDKSVTTGSAASSDYTDTGYDRGHMAPAADFAYDEKAMYESFYMSNIAPQQPKLNRGAWAQLEDWVRDVTRRENSLVVVTGPVVTGEVARIGKRGVAVPHGFFKALYDDTPPSKMLGFYYANGTNETTSLADHVISIDRIEELTGLNLFPNVPDAEIMEASTKLSAWLEKRPTMLIVK